MNTEHPIVAPPVSKVGGPQAAGMDRRAFVVGTAAAAVAAATPLRQARAAGRPVFLVTAADQSVADLVARHLGLFDGVFGSDGQSNLKGAAKAAFLVQRFGAQKFDYAGDAEADRPVWRVARQAIVINPGAGLLMRVRAERADAIVLGAPASAAATLRTVARAVRLHQWAKNLLIFTPMLAAHRVNAGALLNCCFAFAAFSLCASSVYLLNDLVDLPHDRAHASKRRRPFASGALNLSLAPPLMLGLLGAALVFGLLLPPPFLLMLGGYYACTLSYSFVLKRQMVWDVIMLAGLYTVRVFAGGAATGVPVSPWLLAFALFLFFCLAVVKRLTELTLFVRNGGGAKLKGRGYAPEDLDMLRSMAASSGTMAVLVMALYVNSAEVRPLYQHPTALWALCPILLFWVSRVLLLANRGQMNDDPVVFALRDRVSLASGGASLIAILVATL